MLVLGVFLCFLSFGLRWCGPKGHLTSSNASFFGFVLVFLLFFLGGGPFLVKRQRPISCSFTGSGVFLVSKPLSSNASFRGFFFLFFFCLVFLLLPLLLLSSLSVFHLLSSPSSFSCFAFFFLTLSFFYFLLSCFLSFNFILFIKSLTQTSPFLLMFFSFFGCFFVVLLSLLLCLLFGKKTAFFWSKSWVATNGIFWQPPVFKSIKS